MKDHTDRAEKSKSTINTKRHALSVRHKIYVRHDNVPGDLRLSIKLIKKCIADALRCEEVFVPCEISVLVVNNESMKELNKCFRGIDASTDVLSFPLQELIPGDFKIPFSGNVIDGDVVPPPLQLGDIVISAETVRDQAAEFGHTTERETAYLTIHSLLHLLGYDHIDEAEGKRQMRLREEAILINGNN